MQEGPGTCIKAITSIPESYISVDLSFFGWNKIASLIRQFRS